MNLSAVCDHRALRGRARSQRGHRLRCRPMVVEQSRRGGGVLPVAEEGHHPRRVSMGSMHRLRAALRRCSRSRSRSSCEAGGGAGAVPLLVEVCGGAWAADCCRVRLRYSCSGSKVWEGHRGPRGSACAGNVGSGQQNRAFVRSRTGPPLAPSCGLRLRTLWVHNLHSTPCCFGCCFGCCFR